MVVLFYFAYGAGDRLLPAFGDAVVLWGGRGGALPNASVAISRWFPVHDRGRAFGIAIAASQLGGALAPLLVVPIQIRYGWRASFFLFGILGVAWSGAWYGWFRDSPAEKAGISLAELEETRGLTKKARHGLPWKRALRSSNFWATMGGAFCATYPYYFFSSWFHTYLVKARGYTEHDLLLSSLPFLVGACANVGGGFACAALVRRLGLKWGQRSISVAGLGGAAVCTVAVIFTQHWLGALVLLSLVYGFITFQQPTKFAACLDIGGECAGAIVGAMNMVGQIGSFVSSLAFGYLVERYGSYDAPFVPMAVLLVIGAGFWLKVDPTERLVGRAEAAEAAEAAV